MSSSRPRPFFLLQHGVDGSARDLDALASALWDRFRDDDPLVFRPTCSEGTRTHDGIAAMAARLVVATTDFLRDAGSGSGTGPLALFLVGHSLGGLVLRAALPDLLAVHPRLAPVAYVSLSTPHLGSRRPRGSVGASLWRAAVHGVTAVLFGYSGQELLMQDAARVVVAISDPSGAPMRALQRFPSVTFVAVPHGDLQVPFCSASARPDNPYARPGPGRPRAMEIAGHDGLPDSHVTLLWPHLSEAARRSATAACSPAPLQWVLRDEVTDRYRETEVDTVLLGNLRRGLPGLRRVDVQFALHTPLTAHDAIAGKTDQGRAFVALLATLLHADYHHSLATRRAVSTSIPFRAL